MFIPSCVLENMNYNLICNVKCKSNMTLFNISTIQPSQSYKDDNYIILVLILFSL